MKDLIKTINDAIDSGPKFTKKDEQELSQMSIAELEEVCNHGFFMAMQPNSHFSPNYNYIMDRAEFAKVLLEKMKQQIASL